MRAITALLVFLVVVFVGSALCAPPIYQAVQHAALNHTDGIWYELAKQPFHRYVHRLMQVLAILGIGPLARRMGLRRMKDIGVTFDAKAAGGLARGFLIGFATLLVGAVAAVALGARTITNFAPSALIGATVAALLVPIFEELLFRGLIHGGLRRNVGFRPALIVSSFLYALLHFFARPENPAKVEWNSGLLILAGMCQGFTEVQQLIPAFLTLFLLGVVFAVAFERTGTLWLSMGAHAGLIFWVKVYGSMTQGKTTNPLWGGDRMVDGWMAFALGMVLLGAVIATTRKIQPKTQPTLKKRD